MAYSIILDAGHGGSDPGAVYNGRQEKDDALRLALAVGEILQNHGIDVEDRERRTYSRHPYKKLWKRTSRGQTCSCQSTGTHFPQTMKCQGSRH